jgi:nucleotide-binding universal stress UspA family protein
VKTHRAPKDEVTMMLSETPAIQLDNGSATAVVTTPVMVACDGDCTQDALFSAARKVSSALRASIEVIGVCPPTAELAVGFDMIPTPRELDESRRAAMYDDVKRAVSAAPAGDTRWPVEIVIGSPARTIALEAARRHASVLVMGIGRHNPLDRLFGAEVTLATLRESEVPVLAVGGTFTGPSHVLVGLDFSECSIRAAQLALQLLEGRGKLTLLHARPRLESGSRQGQEWDAAYSRNLPPLFDTVMRRLVIPAHITVETATVRGEPASTLLSYAQQSDADMIAIGTQRHGLIERLLVGSVATRILRTARCSVLAVTGRAAMTLPDNYRSQHVDAA